ncbi:hypothetical protein GUITHDRAFT_140903 [Guillardia theta CCMP2712]|uniref:Pyrrolo-quinoline quinone repeat domain-containing protein n=1 Tax=Guillardia theta (strain CCMP2712) TaxID=905079 RepID=L1J4K6_GUITC|nr:hypothetical protein GUITHDRAFT_140903 [Guillardia theta CCMP2712]EKX43059.1 hypothetical protein GUITHDRAFT_140903 [Guillardia theta CCMP2712]|eukprot:XP_005830039.1 hypothetical protein GUITHDRAFT_140903 [Guillardia theta CCMP2712]
MAARILAALVLVACARMSGADSEGSSCPPGRFLDNKTDGCSSCCPTNFVSHAPCGQLAAWLADASSRVQLDPKVGSEVWRNTTGGNIEHAPAVSADGTRVYVVSDDRQVYSLDAATGIKGWSYQSQQQFSTSPATSRADNKVYVASGQSLHALDAITGAQVWVRSLQTPVSSRVVVSTSGRSVFVGTSDGVVLALNPSNGVTLWSAAAAREDPVPFLLALSTDGSRLFVGYSDSTLRALNASTGSVLWRFKMQGTFASWPAVSADGSRVFMCSQSEGVMAINTLTGYLLWQWKHAATSFLLADDPGAGRLYVGIESGMLLALDSSDGSEAWGSRQLLSAMSSLAVSADASLVFVGTASNEIHSFSALNGASVWKYTTAEKALGPISLALDPSSSYLFVAQGSSVLALETRFRLVDWYLNAFSQPSCSSLHMMQLWSFQSASVFPVVISNDGNLGYSSSGSEVKVFSTQTGSLLRTFDFDSETLTAPALTPDGRVMVVGLGTPSSSSEQQDETSIRARDSVTGQELWSYSPGTSWSSAPYVSYDGSSVYVLTDGSPSLLALDANSGRLKWSVHFDVTSSASFLESGDKLYITSASRLLVYNYNASSASLSWSVQRGQQALSPPCVSSNAQLVFFATDKSLHAQQTSGGAQVWTVSTGTSFCSALTANPQQDLLHAACSDKRILTLNASSGATIWSQDFGAFLLTRPVVGPRGQFLFVWSSDGSVSALLASSGEGVWHWSSGKTSAHMLPVLSPDGWTVYVTSASDEVLALEIEPCISVLASPGTLRYQSKPLGLNFECNIIDESNQFTLQAPPTSGLVTSTVASSPPPPTTWAPLTTPLPVLFSGERLKVWFHCKVSGLAVSEYQGPVKEAFQEAVLTSMGLQQDSSTSITSTASSSQSRRAAAQVDILSTVVTSVSNKEKAMATTSASLADKIAHNPTLHSMGVSLISMGTLSFQLIKTFAAPQALEPSGPSNFLVVVLVPTLAGSSLLFCCFVAARKRCWHRSDTPSSRRGATSALPPADCVPSAPSYESVFGHPASESHEDLANA